MLACKFRLLLNGEDAMIQIVFAALKENFVSKQLNPTDS